MKYTYLLISCTFLLLDCGVDKNPTSTTIQPSGYNEPHRPQFHFSPDSMWMNDPNGMVFHNGIYHLFYQYYPDSNVWGPMHWGHATSEDMIHWNHKPIALYPDKLGYIFSGSAVLDIQNTSGFGSIENPPLVAIFTYHDMVGQKQKKIDHETQGIAYSLDKGENWIKYDQNPVLLNPGISDFRDPKVRWHKATEKWIMTLAVKDHIRFYSSPDLKVWQLESEFGKELGAHGGVWECPDLFPLTWEVDDSRHWILFVSINPGGPNGGSGTQYFIGDFDGRVFTPNSDNIRWIDYGPDDYAGVTWSNTGDRTIFLGWMSNWAYAQVVPTERWRSANTIPRNLRLMDSGEGLTVASYPVKELGGLMTNKHSEQNLIISDALSLSEKFGFSTSTFDLSLSLGSDKDFDIELYNDHDERLTIRFNSEDQFFTIDRSQLNTPEFYPGFARVLNAPRISNSDQLDLRLVVDVASVELFADGGSTVVTCIMFPEHELDKVQIRASGNLMMDQIQLNQLKSIW